MPTTLVTSTVCEIISSNMNFLIERIKEMEKENEELKKKLEEANGKWEKFVMEAQPPAISTDFIDKMMEE